MRTPEEVLNQAREIIETDGWHQGNYIPTPAFDPDSDPAEDGARYEAALRSGPVCSMGAIHRAMSGLANTHGGTSDVALYRDALVRLQKAAGTQGGIATWNDNKSRSIEDVLLAFKRAVEG